MSILCVYKNQKCNLNICLTQLYVFASLTLILYCLIHSVYGWGEEVNGWGGRELFTEMVGEEEHNFGQNTVMILDFAQVYTYKNVFCKMENR